MRQTFVRYGVCCNADYGPSVFLLCDVRHSHGDNVIVSAVLIAAFYSLLNKLRHGAKLAADPRLQIDKYIDVAFCGHDRALNSLMRMRRQ